MIYLLCFVFFLPPHHPKNAPQSVPRLYTGNGQVKTQITSSTSLVLGITCSISPSNICCLDSRRMTLSPVGILLIKTGCGTLISVLHKCVTVKISTGVVIL